MAYLNSGDIKVFPSTRRTSQNTYARQLTESNLIDITGHITDNDSYVITQTIPGDDDYFKFVVHGYYFSAKFSSLKSAFSSDGTLYAIIKIDTVSSIPEFYELEGQDDGGKYKGVTFSNTDSSAENTYSLAILSKSGNTYIIPVSSLIKFTINSFELDLVDGGEV